MFSLIHLVLIWSKIICTILLLVAQFQVISLKVSSLLLLEGPLWGICFMKGWITVQKKKNSSLTPSRELNGRAFLIWIKRLRLQLKISPRTLCSVWYSWAVSCKVTPTECSSKYSSNPVLSTCFSASIYVNIWWCKEEDSKEQIVWCHSIIHCQQWQKTTWCWYSR